MFKKLSIIFYLATLLCLSLFSWGFVDMNVPLKTLPALYEFVNAHGVDVVLVYSLLVSLLFVFYGLFLWLIHKKKLNLRDLLRLITLTMVIFLFAFPGFSNDIFNYIATAKVIFFYKENPYIIMPIEIPNEPMLYFLHAANKIALYGPAWIIMTFVPYVLGLNNLLLSIFTFKIFAIGFYLGLVWLIWNISKRNLWATAFFALNPLVTIETFVSAHNDVVMMFFALGSFYFVQKRKLFVSLLFLLLSILIKYATLFLLPIYVYMLYSLLRKKEIVWGRIWFWSAIAMYGMFFLSPLREEMYSWYLIWPLTFVTLLPPRHFLTLVSFGFSFGLMFRFAPFIYTRNWAGTTPFIKKIVTFVPPIVAGALYVLKKKA